jgi:hypothetical protein
MRTVIYGLILLQTVLINPALGCEIDCDRTSYKLADLKAKREFFQEIAVGPGGTILILGKACGSGRPLSNLFVFACRGENCSEMARFNRILVDPKSKVPLLAKFDPNTGLHLKTVGADILIKIPGDAKQRSK